MSKLKANKKLLGQYENAIQYGGTMRQELWDTYNGKKVNMEGLDNIKKANRNILLNNKIMVYPRNKFAINSMYAIGGGAINHLNQSFGDIRFGGSTYDKLLYLMNYQDLSDKNYVYKNDIHSLSKYMGLRSNLTMFTSDQIEEHMNVNFNAVPGVSFKSFGFSSKEEAVKVYYPIFKIIFGSWCIEKNSKLKVNEVWSAGSRPKLFNLKDKVMKSRVKPSTCARVVSIASALEQFIGVCLWQPLMHEIEKKFKEFGIGIAIGINKFSDDWTRLAAKVKLSNYVFTGDYSRFDSTIPRHLMLRGLDFIISMFHCENVYQNNYISNFKQWFIDNIIDKTYLVDNKYTCEVKNGVPSGSLWTSLLDSICNYILLDELLITYGIREFCEILVYGDDHMILIRKKRIKVNEFMTFVGDFTKKNFGMTNNVDKMNMATKSTFFVTYKRPVYSVKDGVDFSKGTRNLKPIKYQYSNTPFTEWDHSKGTTHRWSYVFKGRPVFLSFYFLIDGTPLRPWSETLTRIINPENKIRNVEEHMVVLKSHYIDNFNNAHARNWLMHLLYDAEYQLRNYDREKGKFLNGSDLFISPVKRELFHAMEAKEGDRMWYRRREGFVDLTQSPCMFNFLERIHSLNQHAISIFNTKSSLPFYKKKEFELNLIRKGITTKDELRHFILKTGYFHGLREALVKLEGYKDKSTDMNAICDRVIAANFYVNEDLISFIYSVPFWKKKTQIFFNGTE